jgi:hypothetical protein
VAVESPHAAATTATVAAITHVLAPATPRIRRRAPIGALY